MREKEVEQKLVKAVKLAGGFCIKFTSPGFDGGHHICKFTVICKKQ